VDTIKIGRYDCAPEHGWGGWIEPESREWILFVPHKSGTPEFYFRDPRTGGVIDRERFTDREKRPDNPV
jgi:hypothetical protein